MPVVLSVKQIKYPKCLVGVNYWNTTPIEVDGCISLWRWPNSLCTCATILVNTEPTGRQHATFKDRTPPPISPFFLSAAPIFVYHLVYYAVCALVFCLVWLPLLDFGSFAWALVIFNSSYDYYMLGKSNNGRYMSGHMHSKSHNCRR